MANKPFNSRIQLKHDTETNWAKASGFSPLAGEVIIYDADSNYTYPRFKVGDGSTNVNSLPFATKEAAQKIIDNTIAAASTSTNLPTSAAVAAFVEGKGYTTNIGTITGITMNGTSKGTSGVVNLGTVITAHQDISGKADKTATVSNVAYDTSNKKITKTINDTTSDVVSAATLKTDMSLNNVENKSSTTIRSEITSSNVTTALGFTPLNSTLKGANSGVAELDANGKVPSSQLPSYVDDVLEYSTEANFPSVGETGKIYVDTTTNKTYRWSGSNYIEISASLALGTTSSTAFRGDYGNAAYNHAVINKGSAFSSGLYKITTNDEGHVISATAVEKADLTSLGVADALNVPTKTSDLTNDSGFIITETDPTVPAWAKASTKPSYTAGEVGALRKLTIDADTTQSDNGLPENVSARADAITISETNNHIIGSLQFQVYKDGSVMTQLSSMNYVDSQWKKEGISITLAKSGAVSYSISSPKAFRSAISAAVAPLIINTSNVYSTDALTYDTTVTLIEGQLLFVFLSKKMQGLADATLKLGNNDAINIYLTTSTPLNAAFAQGSVLGLIYHNSNLYMINPPVAI